MKSFIQNIPIPFCGVMLAVTAFGVLCETRWPIVFVVCGVISAIMLLCIGTKLILFPKEIAADLDNPVLSGVAGTFPMALMYQAVYVAKLSWHIGFIIWAIAVVLFFILIVRFTILFACKAKLADLTPAYFVIYIGVMAAAVVSPVFGTQTLGSVLTWIGFVVTAVLVVLVTVRFVRYPALPAPLKPLLCIYAAPPSMCLVAYLSSVSNPIALVAGVVYVFSCGFYIVGLVMLVRCLKLPFAPTYAAMTFPFVIAAAASAKYAVFLGVTLVGHVVSTVSMVQLGIAAVSTLFVLVRYIVFLAEVVRHG